MSSLIVAQVKERVTQYHAINNILSKVQERHEVVTKIFDDDDG